MHLLEYFTDEDGLQHIYRSHKFGIASEQGEWIGNAVIAEEVTALEQAQLTIAEQKARIEGILNSSSESIWSVNRNFDIEFANDIMRRDFLQAFGIDLLPGVNILAALPAVLRPAWQQRYEQVFAGEMLDFQERVDTNDSTFFLRLRFYPIRVGSTVVAMAGFSKNVTAEVLTMKERNRFYELVEQQNGALKSMARNHTHGMMPHLQQIMAAIAQLRQAQSGHGMPGIEAALTNIEAAAEAIGTLVKHNMERVKMVEAGTPPTK
jgi:PAS domain-containing protein